MMIGFAQMGRGEHEMWDEDFAEWLSNEMEIRELTRGKLAKKTGISVSTVRKCELGIGTPTLFTVSVLLDAFGKKLAIVDKEEV